jgi:hypothetical protein
MHSMLEELAWAVKLPEQQLNQQSLGSGVVSDMMSPVGAGKHTERHWGYNVAMHRHDHSIVTASQRSQYFCAHYLAILYVLTTALECSV